MLKTFAMTRVKTLALAALVATTVGISGFANVPSAEAARMSCDQALRLHAVYMAHGNVAFGIGNTQTASYWYGRATGVLDASC